MTTELTLLAWTLVLALAQILLVTHLRTREVGLAYNISTRDVPPLVPPGIVTGRMIRAQRNLFETLPLFAVAILIVHVAHLESPMTYWGAVLYFCARLVYVPFYAFGIKYARTLAWFVSVIGLVLLLVAIFCPTSA